MSVRPRRLAFGLVVLALLVPAASPASDMGFRISFTFPPSGSLTWISLPYRYAPADFGTLGTLDSEDLCHDLGSVTSIVRWNEASSQFVSYTCGSPSGWFTLAKGSSYGVGNSGVWTTPTLTGSHDGAYAFNTPPDGGSDVSWISIPYHVKIPDNAGTPPGVDAEDLCRSVGTSTVFAVKRWNPGQTAYLSYACGSTLDTPFPIVTGTGYGLVNVSGQTITWTPPHF